jgi:alpha-D-ribose 1-methylphosphonate 5-triphosphate synthase subunit PhnL
MPLLTVENFSKTFAIHALAREVGAFAAVNFTLHAGELLLVRGANGVGKSTLLRCLYRTYLPSSGHAYYQAASGTIDLASAADVDIAQLRRTEIGNVSQFLRPRPRVSARELVMEPLLHAGESAASAQVEAEQWLTAFGVKPAIWEAYPTTFSGGEQQKVNLARALIAPRRLILLDEPTASLDAGARGALRTRIADLKAAGVALIAVFHHAEDIAGLVDQVLELQV